MKNKKDNRERLARVFEKPKHNRLTRQEKDLLDFFSNCVWVDKNKYEEINKKLNNIKEM